MTPRPNISLLTLHGVVLLSPAGDEGEPAARGGAAEAAALPGEDREARAATPDPDRGAALRGAYCYPDPDSANPLSFVCSRRDQLGQTLHMVFRPHEAECWAISCSYARVVVVILIIVVKDLWTRPFCGPVPGDMIT